MKKTYQQPNRIYGYLVRGEAKLKSLAERKGKTVVDTPVHPF